MTATRPSVSPGLAELREACAKRCENGSASGFDFAARIRAIDLSQFNAVPRKPILDPSVYDETDQHANPASPAPQSPCGDCEDAAKVCDAVALMERGLSPQHPAILDANYPAEVSAKRCAAAIRTSCRHSPAPLAGGVDETPAGRVPELEATRRNAEYWVEAGRTADSKDQAIMCVMQAVFAWKNAAYGLHDRYTKVTPSSSAGGVEVPGERTINKILKNLDYHASYGLQQDQSIAGEAAVAIRALRAATREANRANSWVREVRNLARELGLEDDASNGSIADWRFIKHKIDSAERKVGRMAKAVRIADSTLANISSGAHSSDYINSQINFYDSVTAEALRIARESGGGDGRERGR